MNSNLKLIKNADGQTIECQFYLGEHQEFSHEKALVFYLAQNHPHPVESDAIEKVVGALVQSGRSVLRVPVSESTQIEQILRVYAECCEDLGKNFQHFVLFAHGKNANDVVYHYNDFFQIQPPTAIILVSTSAEVIHLNNLTCNYMLIYQENDSAFETRSLEALEEAVHHHQMRYGDSTTLLILPKESLPSEGNPEFNTDLVHQTLFWLKSVPVAPSHHRPRVIESA